MELLIMSYACKTSCALKIIAVVPYLPYSKQSRLRKRGSIPCKLLAQMMKKSGISHVITMDLHQKEIQGFFDFPIDNLRASPFLLQYIKENIPDYCNAVIVARHPDTAKRVTSYAERLGLGIAVIHGNPPARGQSEDDDGRHSPPPPRETSSSPPFESLSRQSVSSYSSK
jgi:ribose-phosphate pyrophosphokinase